VQRVRGVWELGVVPPLQTEMIFRSFNLKLEPMARWFPALDKAQRYRLASGKIGNQKRARF